MGLAGKTALVTGGGSGIGLATAKKLLDEGVRVIITGRREKLLEEACRSLGSTDRNIDWFPCDLSKPRSIERLLNRVVERAGTLDFLVNNAGIYMKGALEDMPLEKWDETFEVNVRGLFLVVKGLVPYLKPPSASIVNIASTLAYQTALSTSAYAASKAAVVSLTRSMARELGPKGIRVNCICPGIVDTPVHDGCFASEKEKRGFFRNVARQLPLGRIGRPEDVAAAVLFLLGEEASWITGAMLPVDGGISIL